MITSRYPLLMLVLGAVLLSACGRQEFPETVPPTPTFWLKGTLDGEPWEHNVGLDNSFLYTYAEHSEDQLWMESILADPECVDCPPLAAFNLHAPGDNDPANLLDAGADWSLTSDASEVLYWGDFSDVLEEDFDVLFNGEFIEDGEVLLTFEPFTSVGYSVLGDVNEFEEFAWSVEAVTFISLCPTESLTFPGIDLEVEDEQVFIYFSDEFEYNSVTVSSGYPTANATFAGGEPVVFPIVDFWPLETLFFSFEPADPFGILTYATLDMFTFEWEEISVPPSAIEPEVVVVEPWAQIYLEIDGESWISHEVCFAFEYEQPAPNGLNFTSSEAFDPNDDGLLTRKVSFELEVDLYKEADPAQVRHLIINDGVLAFALPD